MSPTRTSIAAVALYVASAAALNVPVLRAVGDPRPAPAVARAKHPDELVTNDTAEYVAHLERAADAVGEGRVYFPVTDFDCPVTFLLPCGVVRHLTGWNPVAVLNGFALVVWVLNGVFAFGFLREIGVAPVLAAVLGLAYQGCNHAAFSHHMGHMNNLQQQWLAAAFWATAGLCRPAAGWGWVVSLGLAVGLQLLSAPGYAVYLVVAGLPAFVLAYWHAAVRWEERPMRDAVRFVGRGAIAGVVAGLVAVFYLVPRLGHPPRTFPPPTWLPYAFDNYLELLDPSHPTLFLGLPLFVLAVLAANGWWAVRTPMATACLATVVVAAVMMVPAVPGSPYWVVYQLIPPVRHLRVPTRFFPILLLNLLGLVGLYLSAVAPNRRRLVAGALVVAFAVGYWFTSDWFYPVDPIPTVKRWLGKD